MKLDIDELVSGLDADEVATELACTDEADICKVDVRLTGAVDICGVDVGLAQPGEVNIGTGAHWKIYIKRCSRHLW